MAHRHSVSPAATPDQHGQSTTAQPYSGLAVPAAPTGSTEHRSGNTVVPSGPQLDVASHSRRGHRTSNRTPPIWRTLPTSKFSEGKQSVDPKIFKELLPRIVEVETEPFVQAVLYKGSETMMKEDWGRAAQYLELLETPSPHEGRGGGDPTDSSPQQPTTPPPTTIHPAESTPNSRPSTSGVPPHRKPLPRESYRRERDMYPDHVELLNSVSRFFQADKTDVDEAWLPAQSPPHDITTASQNAGPPLNRVFQDTNNQSRSFSRYKYGQAGLRPDLCLLIESGGAPEESGGAPEESGGAPEESGGAPEESESEPKESKPKPKKSKPRPKRSKPKPKKSKPKPKVTPHWKDVLVPIELKRKKNMDTSDLVQMAQYARSVLVEQYDRTFVITILITGSVCRVFHWDVAGAQVTRPFSIHKNTQLFLQVIGRLATMTPSELGYDTNFSNAGRVRSTEKIETHLTIHLSKPRPFLKPATPSPTPECPHRPPSPECPHELVVKLEEMLFESTNGLFSRATRVWTAVPVNDPPPQEPDLWSKKDTYIVKQNWADDKRPNEGIFHTLTQNVAAVPKLVGMEEREFTGSFRTRFEKKDLKVPPLVARALAKRTPIPGGDGSVSSAGGSTGVGSADVRDEDSWSEDMSVDDEGGDDVGSDAASDDDEQEGLRDEEEASDEEVGAEDVVDQKVANEAGPGNKEPLERVLVRFVFKGQGRPLSEATDSIELLKATAQWVTGLIALDDLGITHRDISYGNLLLPFSNEAEGQASIIDLGLAHLKDLRKILKLYPGEYRDQDIETIWADFRPHHHVTGTLPFVAIGLLQKAEKKQEATHAFHHDLESVFWVLLYTCIKHHEGKDSDLSTFLGGMTSSDPHVVFLEKKNFFTDGLPLQNMGGDFYELEGFLREFGSLCRQQGNVVQAAEILTLISNEIQEILKQREMREMQRVAKRKLENPPEHGPAPARKKKAHSSCP